MERMLYNYNVKKCNAENLKVEIAKLSLPYSLQGLKIKEYITDHAVTNQPEEEYLRKEAREEKLENAIKQIENEIKQIENALSCLNPLEKTIIEEKYFKGSQWWQISGIVKYSESWCKRVRKEAIVKMIDTFNLVSEK